MHRVCQPDQTFSDCTYTYYSTTFSSLDLIIQVNKVKMNSISKALPHLLALYLSDYQSRVANTVDVVRAAN